MAFCSANDLSFLEISANRLKAGKKKKFQLPADQERLILIKSGSLVITLGDSTTTLGKGSVAMIMPSDHYVIQTTGKEDCLFHQMTYRSKTPIDASRGRTAGGSFVKDWNKITFRAHDRGGVRSYFERPTAMAKRFEIHVTTLKGGLSSHPPHTHAAEEIILVLDGKVEMLIGEKSYKGQEGDVLFVPTNLPHGLKNDADTPCSYFAIQWE
jgi:(S)-ureidoglycine aminohydrolase